MNDEAWSEDADRWLDAGPGDLGASFAEQIVRGEWPVRVGMPVEIDVEGSRPRVHPLGPGQKRRKGDSRILTIELQFDRAQVREMMLKQIRTPREKDKSRLPEIVLLARVDRACFLETAAAHFVELFSSVKPKRDPLLVDFLGELHEFDNELIGEVVAETIRVEGAAGARLREAILDAIEEPSAREELGWLAAAAIRKRCLTPFVHSFSH